MNTSLMKKSFQDTGKAIRYHKKHILVSILAMVLLFGILCFCGGGYSFTYNSRTYDTADYEGFLALPFSMLDDITSSDDLDTISDMVSVEYDNGRSGAAAILSSPEDSDTLEIGGYDMNGLMKIVRKTNGLAVVLATWLLVITWAIGFLNQETKGYQMEELAKRFLMLVIGFIGVFIAMNLSFYIMNLGTGVAAEVADAADAVLSSDSMENAISKLKYEMLTSGKKTTSGSTWEKLGWTLKNFTTSLGYAGEFFVAWIVTKVAMILIQFTCWSRAFELVILAIFSPFAFADVVDIHRIGMGSGSRYLKNIGSIALSGAIIILVVSMGKLVQVDLIEFFNDSGTSFAEASATLGDMALVALATGGLCLKAPSLSKSVLGMG